MINRLREVELPLDRPRELLNYDPESGQVIWHRRDDDAVEPLDLTVQANAISTKHILTEFTHLA